MTERWGMWLVELHGMPVGQWLKDYDIEAFDGRGDAHATSDAAEALAFPSQTAVFEAWKQVSQVRPVREDGKPNRPLSAFTVTPTMLP